jgi:hypothetical protein
MTPPPRPILASLSSAQLAHVVAALGRHVDRSGGPDACWPWTGGTFNRGYGILYIPGTASTRRNVLAHRAAYELAHDGECPPVIDHICHDNDECKLGESCTHRRCCNWTRHLAPETVSGNLSRAVKGIYREMCGAGHRMSGENVYEAPDGSRHCRPCAAEHARERRAVSERRARAPLGSPRPQGVPAAELVRWALDGQDPSMCMFWPGVRPNRSGYVDIRFDGAMVAAHRLVYEVRRGPIRAGYVVDHICHEPQECSGGNNCTHRSCMCPSHLSAIPASQNSAAARSVRHRPESCKYGHSFTPENTHVSKRGTRHCVTCKNNRQRQAREAAKEADWTDGRLREGNLCPNGHDVTEAGLTSAGKCAQCTRDTSQKAKRTAREKRGAGSPPERVVAPGTLCVNGHDKSVVGISSSYACNECVAERKRAKRAQAKADPGWADKRTRPDGMCKKGLHVLAVTGKTTNGSCAECKREGDARRSAGLVTDGAGSRRTRQGGICRNGHDVAVVGIAKGGSCAECAREKSRRFAARRELRR